MAQFSDTTGQDFGSSSSNATGLTNAANLATNNLVVSYMLSGGKPNNTGIPTSYWANNDVHEGSCGDPTNTNCGTLLKMDTTANILAACVNSAGRSATLPTCAEATEPCDVLFACTGTAPSGTALQAAHMMATRPASNVSNLFAVQGSTPSFAPYTDVALDDWTLALAYCGGGLDFPRNIAVDGAGNVWAANNGGNSLSEFNPFGTAISPSTGYTGGGLNNPLGIAVDPAGNVWATNYGGNSLSEFSLSGTPISPRTGYTGGGLNGPWGIAVDPSGNVWAGNIGYGTMNTGSLSEFSSSGEAISPSTGFTSGGLFSPAGIAVDVTGDVWVANNAIGAGGSLSEFSSSGIAISPSSGFTGGGLNGPEGISLDAAGNVWIANFTSDHATDLGRSLSEFNSSGLAVSPSDGYIGGGLFGPYGIAVDATGNVWAANYTSNRLSEFSALGGPISPDTGYSGGPGEPSSIAIDAGGNVWLGSAGDHTINEFLGLAKPVLTPLVACLKQGKNVCLP
ncbi:MAG: hypothetical protein ACLQDV_25720 [Candidatus Binataceae bacterium]